MARPYLRASQPIPPPSVRPEIPTEPASPNGVARPWAAAATVYSDAVSPACAHASAPIGVDVEALHGAEIEDDPAVVRAVAREAVPATADRQAQAGFAGERDGPRDVLRVGSADDQRGVPIGRGIVDLARQVVVRAAGQDDRAVQAGLEGSRCRARRRSRGR